MKKWLLLFSVSILHVMAAGQVLINLQLPPGGLTVKSQLWNFSIINTGNSTVDVKVQVLLRDMATNQLVFTGTSKTFLLPKGLKQVQYADVMPVSYMVNNSSYGTDASPDGFLPVGVFSICFTVMALTSDISETVAEACESIEVEPISPPMLVTPSDSDYSPVTRPFFTWTPPVPFNLFNNLQYDWVLVEVHATQTAAVAIQQNFPLMTQSVRGATNFQYPLTSPELDTGKLYAWQIVAKNNVSAVGKSEVWTFRVGKFALDSSTPLRPGYFIKLIKENNPSYAVCTGILRYEYVNEINDLSVTVKFYDISNAANIEVVPAGNTTALQFGQNFLTLALKDDGAFIHKHLYLLELTNSKNEVWRLKFEYNQAR